MPEPPGETRGDREVCREPRAGRRAHAERTLERFARDRDGIVTTAELLRFGIGKDAIAHRQANGRLFRLHRGVFLLGRCSLSQRGRWRAAVAACGRSALLSHLSAAALWGVLDDDRIVVDVITPSGARPRTGIRVHEARDLTGADRALRHAVPLTAMPRTLIDLAGVVAPRTLETAVREAERGSLLDVEATLALCSRGRRGSGVLRKLLERDFRPALGTRSELEVRFLELCERYHLPTPAVNVYVTGLLVDCLFIRQQLVVELDGFEYHRTRSDQRRDAERDRRLTVAGYTVVRFGWHDVNSASAATARTIRELLRRGSSLRSSR